MSMFGRNGKTPAEKDQRNMKFDARPPDVRAAGEFESINQLGDGSRTPIEPPIDYDIDAALDNITRKLDILLAERETTNQGIAAIKQIVAGLSYGDMMDLAEQLSAAMPDQSGNLEAKARMRDVLPSTFHKWATS